MGANGHRSRSVVSVGVWAGHCGRPRRHRGGVQRRLVTDGPPRPSRRPRSGPPPPGSARDRRWPMAGHDLARSPRDRMRHGRRRAHCRTPARPGVVHRGRRRGHRGLVADDGAIYFGDWTGCRTAWPVPTAPSAAGAAAHDVPHLRRADHHQPGADHRRRAGSDRGQRQHRRGPRGPPTARSSGPPASAIRPTPRTPPRSRAPRRRPATGCSCPSTSTTRPATAGAGVACLLTAPPSGTRTPAGPARGCGDIWGSPVVDPRRRPRGGRHRQLR